MSKHIDNDVAVLELREKYEYLLRAWAEHGDGLYANKAWEDWGRERAEDRLREHMYYVRGRCKLFTDRGDG